MSIRLTQAILIAGAHTPVDGATLTLNAALEADLVNGNKAVYVSGAPVGGAVAVTSQTDEVTGVSEVAMPSGKTLYNVTRPDPIPIREFTTLQDITNSASGGTTVASIDPVSPIDGKRAMKLAIGAGVGTHDVTFSGMNFPDFTGTRGKFVVVAYFEDPRAISQIQLFVGTDSSFGTNARCDHRMANDGVHFSHGVQQLVFEPEQIASTNIATTGDVTAFRIRISRSGTPITDGVHNLPGDVAASAYATNAWFKGVYIPPTTKPFIILTCDDSSTSWIDYLQPVLAARNIKATFGVNKNDVGTNDALYCTEAELNTLYAYGHDMSSHNLANTAFTIAGFATYQAAYRTCRDWHRAAGRTRRLDYHPYVQGAFNNELSAALESEGVRWARSVNSRNFERPLWKYGNYMQLPSRTLGNVNSLSAVQAWITQAETRNQDVVLMGHVFGPTAADSTTWAISDMAALLDFCLAEQAAGRIDGVGSLSDYINRYGF